MFSKSGSYDVEELNRQKRQQEKVWKAPSQANILAAASHIRQLFENKKYTYAILAGLEMLCLGHQRELQDLHIAYDDKDFVKIKAKLDADKRVQIPEGMNPLLPSKILVSTGPAYRDLGCTEFRTVEVNMIPPGSHGTPSSGLLNKNHTLLCLKTDGVLKTYKGLNMLYLVRTLLHFCKLRNLAWDPRKDLLYLCKQHGDEVKAIRKELDQGDRREIHQYFLGTSLVARLSFEDKRRCYEVLLGKQPLPPTTAGPVRPQDSHLRSVSSPLILKAGTSSRDSLPMPSTQQKFLSPSQPEQTRQHQRRVTSTGPQSFNASPLRQAPSDSTPSAQTSRSRYRQTMSVPSTRYNSSEDLNTGNNPPNQSIDMRQISRKPIVGPQNDQINQELANTGPRTNSPVPSILKTRRPVTPSRFGIADSLGGNTGSQTDLTKDANAYQFPQRPIYSSAVELPTTPAHHPPHPQLTPPILNIPKKTRICSAPPPLRASAARVETSTPPSQSHINPSEPTFELDASPPKPSHHTTTHPNPPSIILELTSNIDAALRTSPTPSPPPTTTTQHIRSISTPLLPTALTIGHHPSPNHTTPTNLSRYTAAPSAFAPAPLAVYKAYSPPTPPMSPTPPLLAPERQGSFGVFGQLRDVDGAEGYYGKGSGSVEVRSKSGNSETFAMEYRVLLPEFERGYVSS